MATYTLTLAQKTLIEKARNVGNSEMAVPLSAEVCAYLCGVVAKDLNLVSEVPEVPQDLPAFFETWPVSSLTLAGIPFDELAAKVFALKPDSDTYFSCLATLHKSRLKYEQILQRQAFPPHSIKLALADYFSLAACHPRRSQGCCTGASGFTTWTIARLRRLDTCSSRSLRMPLAARR